jgi:hypothetical protein
MLQPFMTKRQKTEARDVRPKTIEVLKNMAEEQGNR